MFYSTPTKDLPTNRLVRQTDNISAHTKSPGSSVCLALAYWSSGPGLDLFKGKRGFVSHSLSWSPAHRPDMTIILFEGRKLVSHPCIHIQHAPAYLHAEIYKMDKISLPTASGQRLNVVLLSSIKYPRCPLKQYKICLCVLYSCYASASGESYTCTPSSSWCTHKSRTLDERGNVPFIHLWF